MEQLAIYLIDDDHQVRQSFTQMLDLDGYTVTSFSSAEEFLNAQAIVLDSHAVVISDIKMPGMSGLELMDDILLIDADIPVVLITGHADIAMAI